MKHNLLKATYNDVHKLIKPAYCRGAPPGESGVKKENITSNFGAAVVCKNFCGLFAAGSPRGQVAH